MKKIFKLICAIALMLSSYVAYEPQSVHAELNVDVTVEENGDIVVSSNDQQWLSDLASEDNGYFIFKNDNGTYYIGNSSENNSEMPVTLRLEEGRVVFSAEAQDHYGFMYGEEYVLGFEVFSRDDGYLEWGTVVIKAGDRPAPLDVSVDVLKNGDFIIYCSDENWLQAMMSEESAIVAEYNDSGYHFGNTSDHSEFVMGDGCFTLSGSYIKKAGIPINKQVTLSFHAIGYDTIYDFNVVTRGLKEVPNDLSVYMRPDDTMVIETQDTDYLMALLSNEGYSYVEIQQQWATVIDSDLYVLNGPRLELTKKSVEDNGHQFTKGEEAEIKIYVEGYESAEDIFVTIPWGIYKSPTDIQVSTNSDGDIVITTSDEQWMSDFAYSGGQASFKKNGTWYSMNSSAGYFEFTGDSVLITDEGLKTYGYIMGNTYELRLFLSGYGYIDQTFTVTLTGGVKQAPEDIEAFIDPESKQIELTTEDIQYLMDLATSANSVIYFEDEYGDKHGITNYWEIEYYFEDNKVIISSQVQKNHNLINGKEYTITIEVPGYLDSIAFNIIIEGGINLPPEDVEVYFEDNNMIVSSDDFSWINQLGDLENYGNYNEIRFESEDGIFVWVGNREWKTFMYVAEEGKLVIPEETLKEKGIAKGEVYSLSFYLENCEPLYLEDKIEMLAGANLFPEDFSVTMMEDGSLLFESEDEDFLEYLASSVDADVSFETYNSTTILEQNEYNQIFEREEAGIVVDSKTLIRYGLEKGNEYEVYVRLAGYKNYAAGPMTMLTGIVDPPKDITAYFDEDGNFVVESQDVSWLNGLTYEYGHIAFDGEAYHYFSNNEWYQPIEMKDNKIIIELEHLIDNAVIAGETYELSLWSFGYDGVYGIEITATHGLIACPDDVEISFTESNDLKITSEDTEWLTNMLEIDSYLYFESEDGGIHIGNNEHSFVLKDGSIIVSAELLIENKVVKGSTYFVWIQSYGYQSVEIGEILCEPGVELAPDDVKVVVNDEGEIVITSEDTKWLKWILDEKYGESIYIVDYNSEESDAYIPPYHQGLRYEDGSVIVSESLQLEKKLKRNKEYVLYISVYGYTDFQSDPFITTTGVLEAPNDVTAVTNEETGDIEIRTSNLDWLKAISESYDVNKLTMIGIYTNEGVYIAEDFTFGRDLIIFDGEKCILPVSSQKLMKMAKDELHMLVIDTYGYESVEISDVLAKDGIHSLPDDIEIVVDEEGNVLISSENTDYINSIMNVILFWQTDGTFVPEKVSDTTVMISKENLMKSLVPGESWINIIAKEYPNYSDMIVLEFETVDPEAEVVASVLKDGTVAFYSSDKDYLKSVAEGWILVEDENDTRLVKSNVLEFTGSRILMSPKVQKDYDLGNSEVSFELYAYGCSGLKTNKVVLTHAKLEAPEDLEIKQNEQGDLVISSNDDEWLKKVNEEGTINVYNTTNADVYFQPNDFILTGNSIVISSELLNVNGIINGKYCVYIHCQDYYPAGSNNVDIKTLVKTAPIIKYQVSGDNLIISGDDQYLDQVALIVLSRDQNYEYEVLDEHRQTGKIVLSLSEQKIIAGEYLVYVHAKGYSLNIRYIMVENDRVLYTAEVVTDEGSQKYETLKEALEAAESGDTVRLLEICMISEDAVLKDGVKLDANGNVIWSDNGSMLKSETDEDKFVQVLYVDGAERIEFIFENISEETLQDGTPADVVIVEVAAELFEDIDRSGFKMDGYLYAGAFTEKECSKASAFDEENPSEKVYLRFVTDDLFTIMAQNSVGIKDSNSGKMRIIASVDSLNYLEVGFFIDIEGLTSTTLSTSTVYSALVATSGSKKIRYTPNMIADESSYFFTMNIVGIPKSFHNARFTIRGYWKTLDGVTVYGPEVEKVISQLPGYGK